MNVSFKNLKYHKIKGIRGSICESLNYILATTDRKIEVKLALAHDPHIPFKIFINNLCIGTSILIVCF